MNKFIKGYCIGTLIGLLIVVLTSCTPDDPVKCNCDVDFYDWKNESWEEICCGYDAQGVDCRDAGDLIVSYPDGTRIKQVTTCQ